MAIYSKDGKYYNTINGIENGEFVTYNPTHEMMLEWGYELYVPQKSEREIEIEQLKNLYNQISSLKRQLAETDYIALKSVEGYDCDALYPNWKQQRSELRNTVNELEEQISQLEDSISKLPEDTPIVIEPAPEPKPVEPVIIETVIEPDPESEEEPEDPEDPEPEDPEENNSEEEYEQ